MYVGRSHGDHLDPNFTGEMRDLLVWDAALSTAELDAVRLGSGLPATPLISMMRTWCGSAPPIQPPSPPPQPPSSPPSPGIPVQAAGSLFDAVTHQAAGTTLHVSVVPGESYTLTFNDTTAFSAREIFLEAAGDLSLPPPVVDVNVTLGADAPHINFRNLALIGRVRVLTGGKLSLDNCTWRLQPPCHRHYQGGCRTHGHHRLNARGGRRGGPRLKHRV